MFFVRYCINVPFLEFVCGDDLLIESESSILNFGEALRILRQWGIIIEKNEVKYFKPKEWGFTFLGSVWDSDGPSRNLMRMCLGAIAMRYRWPYFSSAHHLVKDRLWSVFGYDKKYLSYLRKCRISFKPRDEMYYFTDTRAWFEKPQKNGNDFASVKVPNTEFIKFRDCEWVYR